LEVRAIRTPGLGDTTYVLAHDGVGIVVDPQRDIDRFTDAVDELGVEVRWVLETHLHNDYISGGNHLARELGAELVMPAGAAPAFRHVPAFHGEDLTSGEMRIRPLHTPGHTPEHVSYLVLIDGSEHAVFSGGSLLVGSAGRSDLLGEDRAETLARLQYRSVNRLADLPDPTELFPTHGAGSFCSASVASRGESDIGTERRTNPVLVHNTEDEFVAAHLSGLVPFPTYYAHMGPLNLNGLAPPSLETPQQMDRPAYEERGNEVMTIDARPRVDFAEGHLPGALGVELRRDFGTWVGWIVPFNAPLVLVMNPEQDVEEAVRQLARIGFDRVEGLISDLAPWAGELESHAAMDLEQFSEVMGDISQFLDVRAPAEWEDGTVSGSITRYVPDLIGSIPDELSPDRPVLVACETGYRASIAASVLARHGYRPVVLVDAGVPDILAENG
jgi:hydroxyacylglutathione hydrolase